MSGEVSTELPGGVQFVCKPPGVKAWDEYLDKARAGQQRAGQKQILMKSCTSHKPEDVAKIIDRFPGIVEPIVLELDGLCGSDCEFVENFEDFTFSTEIDGVCLTFDAPNEHRFDQMKRNTDDLKIGFGSAIRTTLRALCREPEAFDELVTRFPTMVGPAMPTLTKMAGADLKITVKKG